MRGRIASAAFAAAVGLTVAVPARASVVPVPNAADFSVSEAPGQYTVFNNSSDWYIFAFAVSNPSAQNADATATSTFANWSGLKVQLDLGGIIPEWTFAYATADANLSHIDNPTLPVFIPADLIGPNSSSNLFSFTPGHIASDYGLVLINADQITVDNVNGITSDVASTPLPAALPMFLGGAGLIGFMARRRKQKRAA